MLGLAALIGGAAPQPQFIDARGEETVVAIISAYAERYQQAPNDMAKGALRPERGHVCFGVQA